MIEILHKMDMIMPLELFGIAIGLVIGMGFEFLFILITDWISNK